MNMNGKVDAKKLASLLLEAPACTPSEAAAFCGEINEYLFSHYIVPFLENEMPPTVGSLDYSAFLLEDTQELERYLNAAGAVSEKLVSIYRTLDSAHPTAELRRAFC